MYSSLPICAGRVCYQLKPLDLSFDMATVVGYGSMAISRRSKTIECPPKWNRGRGLNTFILQPRRHMHDQPSKAGPKA
jgi:hypothetical protein